VDVLVGLTCSLVAGSGWAGRRTPTLTCGFGALGRIRTDDLPITRRMLGVDLVGSRWIWPAQVGWLVGLDGSRRIQTDRVDDHGASDRKPDGKASSFREASGTPTASIA
jgi:hypothetical protein